jgi:hypothetical protein
MGRARKSAAAVAMLAALLGLTLLGTAGSAHAGVSAPARPAAPQAVGAIRYVKNLYTGKCLTVNQQGTANGAKINQYTCVGQTNQQWQFINRQGTFFYELKNVKSGKCLDDPGFSETNGTQLDQWTCTGSWNQWWVENFGRQSNTFEAVEAPSGKYFTWGSRVAVRRTMLRPSSGTRAAPRTRPGISPFRPDGRLLARPGAARPRPGQETPSAETSRAGVPG